MSRKYFKYFYIFLFWLIATTSWADVRWYNATSWIGGTTSSLDSINGQNLVDGDKAIVILSSGQSFIYNLDADSSLAEDSTTYAVVSPDSNAGTKRWIQVWKGGRALLPNSTIDQGDSAVPGTLAWHISNASGNPTTVTAFAGTYTISQNITVPVTMTIKLAHGAIFADDASNAAFAINGRIEAGLYQIFNWGNGTGDITFGASSVMAYYPEWWGADYTTDSAAEFNEMMTSISNGGRVDITERDFRIDSTVTLADGVTIDGTGGSIDFSNAAANDKLFELTGTAGTVSALDANATQHTLGITVTDAAGLFDDGQWLALEDTNTWSTINTSNMGEWVLVQSTAVDAVTLNRPLLYNYYTAQTASVSEYTFKENVSIIGVTATGGGLASEHWFADLSYIKNLLISDCNFTDFEERTIRLQGCIRYTIRNNSFLNSNLAGIGYGVSQQKCLFGVIEGNKFENCRHSMAIGGDEFPSRYIKFVANDVTGSTGASVDTHVEAEYIQIIGNSIDGQDALTGSDGIITTGTNIIIDGNVITGVGRNGILCKSEVTNTQVTVSYVISNNTIDNAFDTANAHGISLVQSAATARAIERFTIIGNKIDGIGRSGIHLNANYGNISHGTINGNSIGGISHTSFGGIHLENTTAFTVKFITIIGNTIERDNDDDAAININADGAGEIANISIIGNTCYNGVSGVLAVNDDFLTIIGNIFQNISGAVLDTDGVNNVEEHNIES